MKSMVVILITAALFTGIAAGRARAETAVGLSAPGNARTVRPNDFVTVAFTATASGTTPESYDMRLETSPGLSSVSILKPITLTPNTETKIPVTFAVSGSAAPGDTLRATLILARPGETVSAARAEAAFTVGRGPCAEISLLPEDLVVAPGGTKDLDFTVKNCGDSKQEFKIDVHAEKGIYAQAPPDVTLAAGGEQAFRITLRARDTEGASAVRIAALAKGLELDQRTVAVRVISPAPEKKRSGYQYIPLVISVDHLLVSDQPSHTALKISIPGFTDNNLTLSSDLWLDTRDDKLETRRRRFDMASGRTEFSFGNMREEFSPMIARSGADERGWRLSRVMGKNIFTLFSGGDGNGRRFSFKWRARAGRGLTITTGFLDDNFSGIRAAGRTRAQSLQAEWLAGPRLKLNTEFMHSVITPRDGAATRRGAGFRIAATYQKSRLQIHSLFQDGHRDTAATGFQSGREFRVSYDTGPNTRAYAEVRRYGLYSTPSVTSTMTAPHITSSESMGASWPAAGGLLMFASLNHRQSSVPLSAGGLRAVDERYVLIQATKQVRALTVVVGVESGQRSENGRGRRYREYAFSGTYHHGGLTLNAELNRTALFEDTAFGALNGRSYSWNIGYTLPNDRLSFTIGRASERGAGLYDTGGATTRTVVGLDAMIQKDSKLHAEYEILNGTNNEKTFTINFSRLLNLKIPYKKNAMLTGMAYADRNRNGRFDEGDQPLPYIRVRLGGHATVTGVDGTYAIYDIAPGAYDLSPDAASYPVGLSTAGAFPMRLSFGGGSHINADIILTPVSRISGRIRVDSGDFFARRARLSPAKRRIVLQTAGQPAAETFSDPGGNYYFENIAQGNYTVSIDPEWLPGSVGIIGPAAFDVTCDGMNSCPAPDFTIGMKKKDVIKTFGD